LRNAPRQEHYITLCALFQQKFSARRIGEKEKVKNESFSKRAEAFVLGI